MANLFLASEILEMNITEERNGAIFYSALSESAKSAKLREKAALIAKQEKTHEERFSQLLHDVERREPEEQYPGEFEGYVQSLLRFKMFPEGEAARLEAKKLSDIEAIEFALKTEHATLHLLKELKKNLPKEEVEVVELTILEEQDHVSQLNALLGELM